MPAVYGQVHPNDFLSKRQQGKRRLTSQTPERLCRVCGQEAAGIYFSALVCLPCKSFFLRCANGKEPNVKCEKKNCRINAATRTICKFCRYKRCLAIGMTRKELPERADAVNGQELCRVCGDVANGVHFGAVTCEGCKNFFRRSLIEETVVCKKGGNCVVNLKTRKGCRGCRYRKCIAAGMSKEAKKPGRRNRPAEILNNSINNMATFLSKVNKNDVNSEEFPSYSSTEQLEEIETSEDFMGLSYHPFSPCKNNSNNEEYVRKHDMTFCPPDDSTDIDAFNLIDDYITDQVVSPVHNVPHESIWQSSNAIIMNSHSETYFTLEPIPSLQEGATIGSPLTPECPSNMDLTPTTSLSSASWSSASSSDGHLQPLSPRNLSHIVIASFDGECPMNETENAYDFSGSFTDLQNANPSINPNNNIQYSESQMTDFDNSPVMFSDTFNDVMELLTEELDLTANAHGGTSVTLCGSVVGMPPQLASESMTDLQNSFENWFSEGKSKEADLGIVGFA